MPGSKKNPYHVLGVGEKADEQEIKDVYRRLARKHHPDAGGDNGRFQEISWAYSLLSDPRARSHYDRHGWEESDFKPVDEAMAVLSQWLLEAVAECSDLSRDDLLARMGKAIKRQRRQSKSDHGKAARSLRKVIQIRRRLIKRESVYPPMLFYVLDGRVKELVQDIRDIMKMGLVMDMAEKLLADYSYRVDEPEPETVDFQMGRPVMPFGWSVNDT